tara:strand:+ start:543 stop:686 length:144 start_codon:yes stop_codon:yes gene_type:complete
VFYRRKNNDGRRLHPGEKKHGFGLVWLMGYPIENELQSVEDRLQSLT